jgi:hypothetical protein
LSANGVEIPLTVAKDTQRCHVQKRALMVNFDVVCTKLAETIEIKSTEPNQKYGQFFACRFSRRYSKVRKVSGSTLNGAERSSDGPLYTLFQA